MNKKKLTAVLVGLLYALVLAGLLILQIRFMDRRIGWIANIGTVTLAVPIFLLLRVQIWLENGGAASAVDDRKEEDPDSLDPVRLGEMFYPAMEKEGLSVREQEVAWLLFRGYTNRQIAEELYISEATVKKHAGHIYEKLQVSGRKEFRDYVWEICRAIK